MIKIIKMNASQYYPFVFGAIGAITLLRLTSKSALNPMFVIISGLFVFMAVIGPLFINEQYEEKNKGYAFLDTLPVLNRDIVTAKFLLVLAADITLVAYIAVLLSFASGPAEQIVIARSYVFLNGVICLLICGLSYIGIMGIGYTKFALIAMSFLVFLGIPPLLIMSIHKENMDVFIEKVLNFYTGLNWLILLPVSIALYLGLMTVAVAIKGYRNV
ncbi:MAG: ABC-2 transporter permease [Candidatus Aminicenantes bacterium]|nr:ABC-2 transporter permease [Candidatus Aminicenantes bacterium]